MLLMAPSICSGLAPIWQIIGWVLFVFKIAIPIIIIIFGMIDLGKAVVASKDDEIKKSIKSLVMRAIAGIVIFFLPTLVGLIFSLVGTFSTTEYQNEYKICRTCVVHPNSGDCRNHVTCAENSQYWDGTNGTDGTPNCVNTPPVIDDDTEAGS